MLISIHDSVHYFTGEVLTGRQLEISFVNRRYKIRDNIINIVIVVK